MTWCWLVLLFGGILAVIVGYIGCFSIVQAARTFGGPLSWLCIEAGLSVIRMIVWGLNPPWDYAPPLSLVLPLQKLAPLPTCTKYDDEILVDKVLPLMRASEFLKSITSFVGLIKYFSHPDFMLYYTMTRKDIERRTDEAVEANGERVLYITIFHHKERTAWVFDGGKFNSTAANLIVDNVHNQLETSLGSSMTYDPALIDSNVQLMLKNHHSSILNGMKSASSDKSPVRQYTFILEWTMEAKNDRDLEILRTTEEPEDLFVAYDRRFLEQGRLEKKLRWLVNERGKWIEDYMKWVIDEMEQTVPVGRDLAHRQIDALEGVKHVKDERKGEESRSKDPKLEQDADTNSKEKDNEQDITDMILMEERCRMEMLLIEEVRRWEHKLLDQMRQLLNELETRPAKNHLVSIWSSNCWRRLKSEMRAMEARMEEARVKGPWISQIRVRVHTAWEDVLEQYVGSAGSQSLPSPSLPSSFAALDFWGSSYHWRFKLRNQTINRCQKREKEMEMRLRKEAEDVEMRLERGLELSDQFKSDIESVGIRHAPSKWRVVLGDHRVLDLLSPSTEVMHIDCLLMGPQDDADLVFKRIRSMPLITSIHLVTRNERLAVMTCPPIADNDHLLSITGDIVQSPEVKRVLARNKSHSKQAVISLSGGMFPEFRRSGRYALQYFSGELAKISFFGPASGIILLRLVHYSDDPNTTVTIVQRKLTFSLLVPQRSWAIDDITLHGIPDERNELILWINTSSDYFVRDIQVSDNPYT